MKMTKTGMGVVTELSGHGPPSYFRDKGVSDGGKKEKKERKTETERKTASHHRHLTVVRSVS